MEPSSKDDLVSSSPATVERVKHLEKKLNDWNTIAPIKNQIFQFEVDHGLDILKSRDDRAEGVYEDICREFSRYGRCKRKKRCQWSHTKKERYIVCKHFLRGLCKLDTNCKFLHSLDQTRMPECYFYTKYGVCSNIECPYRHLERTGKQKECPYYIRGFCKMGRSCRLRHVIRVICANYVRGFCLEGPACQFGHPKFEATIHRKQNDGVEKNNTEYPV